MFVAPRDHPSYSYNQGMNIISLLLYESESKLRISVNNNPVKTLLQDLPRKDPFFLYSCKIL